MHTSVSLGGTTTNNNLYGNVLEGLKKISSHRTTGEKPVHAKAAHDTSWQAA